MNTARQQPFCKDFTGKAALVTGGGSGIGRATAELFAARGAAVAVVDVDAEQGAATVEAIGAAGGQALFLQVDVTREEAVAEMVRKTLQAFGGLHCAFNNAGISGRQSRFHELALPDWDRMIATNLTSVFLCMKHEIAHMVASGGGVIVNTSSGAGLVPAPQQPHYTAAKHGVLGLMKTAAREYAAQNIRVNAVCPGVIDTPMIRGFIGGRPEVEKMLASTLPGGRLGRPEEVAEAVVWLCSDAASFVSGESLLVDGATVCH